MTSPHERDADGRTVAHRICLGNPATDATCFFLDQMFELAPDLINLPAGRTFNGRTALHLAVSSKQYLLIESILKRGAFAGEQDDDRKTAWELAVEQSDEKAMCIFILQRFAADPRRSWFRCHDPNDPPRLSLLKKSSETLHGDMPWLFTVSANKVCILLCIKSHDAY